MVWYFFHTINSFVLFSTSYFQVYTKFLWRILYCFFQSFLQFDQFFLSGLGFRCFKAKSSGNLFLNLGMSHLFLYNTFNKLTSSMHVCSLVQNKTQFFLISFQQHQLFNYLAPKFQPLFRYKKKGLLQNFSYWSAVTRPNKRLSSQR